MARNLTYILPSMLLLIFLRHGWISLCDNLLYNANALLLAQPFLIVVGSELQHRLNHHLEVDRINETVIVEIIHPESYFDFLLFGCSGRKNRENIDELVEIQGLQAEQHYGKLSAAQEQSCLITTA